MVTQDLMKVFGIYRGVYLQKQIDQPLKRIAQRAQQNDCRALSKEQFHTEPLTLPIRHPTNPFVAGQMLALHRRESRDGQTFCFI